MQIIAHIQNLDQLFQSILLWLKSFELKTWSIGASLVAIKQRNTLGRKYREFGRGRLPIIGFEPITNTIPK